MFARYGIPYQSIDLDSVEYQKDDLGGKIRAALEARTGSPTIPQIFIGGQHVGGATELFDAARDGRMQALLERASVAYDRSVRDDPYGFLPGWLQKR
jgi:cysteine synthase A